MNLQNQIEESQNFSSKIPDDWESIDELRVIFYYLSIKNFINIIKGFIFKIILQINILF